MTAVWLAEKTGRADKDVLGMFSTPEKAVQACQDEANGFFGAAKTPPLRWLGDDGYRNAPYVHPCGGNALFQVTRFTVDEKSEP